MKNIKNIPSDGFKGLKENLSSDALSGFLVFLLALPLSLGIAKASDFPPLYGLLTAMIGGIIVSFFAGSPLTIKGPAAGLIVIVASSVAEFGGGEQGWHLTLGAIVVAGLLQIIFGFLKFGKLSDFFPLSAVHGMLAAVGIIIMSKQIHILLGVNPVDANGKAIVEPLELLEMIPSTLRHAFDHTEVTIVGILSLIIVFGWPYLKNKTLKKIPVPLVVLLVSIPVSLLLNIHNIPTHMEHGKAIRAFTPLVSFESGLLDIIGVNESFEGVYKTGTFIKFVLMFALVGSLESLLTVKAIDIQDPWKRKSNYNKDLIAVGIGNTISGILGGLPMISEVARSSANVSNGGRTRWANFFHGIFIMLFLIFAVSFSDLIPNAALAAMLIGVGYKLSNPKEFGHMAKIGIEQIAIFSLTIIVTISTDLLIGIFAGILFKLMIHIYHGAPFQNLFKADITKKDNQILIKGCAVFTNFGAIKKELEKFQYSEIVILDVSACKLVDHTVIENLYHLKDDFKNEGGQLIVEGISELKPIGKSRHIRSARKKKK